MKKNKKRSPLEHLAAYKSVLSEENIFDRQVVFWSLFISTFEGKLELRNYEHSWLRVIQTYRDPREGFQLSQADARAGYKRELIFLRSLKPKQDVPAYVKKVLCKQYLSNLKGLIPGTLIPPYQVRQKGDLANLEQIETEVLSLYKAASLSPAKNEQFAGPVNEEAFLKIFSSPFYSRDIKLLLLPLIEEQKRSSYIEQIHMPAGLLRKPYPLLQKIRLSRTLEDFLILAEYFDLPSVMDEKFEKKTLPYLSSDIINTIIKSRPEKESYNTIADDIRAIFEEKTATSHN